MKTRTAYFLILLVSSFANSALASGLKTESITSKWTWPAGYTEKFECDLGETAASNRAREFIRKVGKANVVEVSTDTCECRKGKARNSVQCRATAHVTYYQYSEASTEQEFKRQQMDKFINYVVPKIQSSLGPLVKLYSTGTMKGTMLGILKGSKIFKYADRAMDIKARVEKIKQRTGALSDKVDQQLDKKTARMLKDLERRHSSLVSSRMSMPDVSQRYFKDPSKFLSQMQEHAKAGFKVDKCIKKVAGKTPTYKNTCDYPVTMNWCAEGVKKACGSKNNKLYTNSTLLRPGQEKNNQFSLPTGKTIKISACVGNRSGKHNAAGLDCVNPY
jgi:hypothetical protein